eukprot:365340-Chlamydomonas_euryale.AAC.10
MKLSALWTLTSSSSTPKQPYRCAGGEGLEVRQLHSWYDAAHVTARIPNTSQSRCMAAAAAGTVRPRLSAMTLAATRT